MYRAVTWKAIDQGLDLQKSEQLANLVRQVDLHLDGDQITLDGRDISQLIRTPEITQSIRFVADNIEVRSQLSALQRRLAEGVDLVTGGKRSRDGCFSGR